MNSRIPTVAGAHWAEVSFIRRVQIVAEEARLDRAAAE